LISFCFWSRGFKIMIVLNAKACLSSKHLILSMILCNGSCCAERNIEFPAFALLCPAILGTL